jgi:hypothetical protein
MNDKTRSLPEDDGYRHAADDMETYIDTSIEDLKHTRLRYDDFAS